MSIDLLLKKHPDKVPVMITRAASCKNLPDIDKNKFLVARTMSMGHMLTLVRQRIKIADTTALFVSVQNKIVPAASLNVSLAYSKYKSDDNILYLQYYGENTFG